MESKHLAIVLIVLIIVVGGVIGGVSYFLISIFTPFIGIEDDPQFFENFTMRNETFGNVKISVPENTTFELTEGSSETDIPMSYESNKGIYIWLYTEKLTKKDVDFLTNDYVNQNNLTKIELEGLSENAKAYKSFYDSREIIIVNDEGNKAVILTVPYSDEMAVKMANSVIFM